MRTFLFALALAACSLFWNTAPAAAQPCQWNYSMQPGTPDPNQGVATARYCGNVQVDGSINVNVGPNTVTNIAALQALTGFTAGSSFYVQGYNTSGDGGGGTFLLTAGTSTGDKCMNFPSAIANTHWVRQLNGAALWVEACGAYNDGTHATQTLAAFQAANDYVAASSAPSQPILALGSHYDFGNAAQGVVKANSYYCPQWIGGGNSTAGQSTLITHTPPSEAPTFLFVGGSGASSCGGGMKGFVFEGNGNTDAVEIQGQCGMVLDISGVVQLSRLVLLHNKLSGQFSENNIMTLNTNGSLFGTVVEYRVTGGNASFHGSGIVGGFINFAYANNPAILIGAGAFPYNAPLDRATFFPVGAAGVPAVVVRNQSSTAFGEPWFVGNIRVEQGGASTVAFGDQNYFLLNGTMSGLGTSFTNGALLTANYITTLLSGQRIVKYNPLSFNSVTTAGVTSVPFPDNTKWNNYMITAEVTGAGYDGYWVGVVTYSEATGGWNITALDQPLPTNTAGYGKLNLSFSTGANNFGISAVTSPFPAGLSYFVTFTQVGQGYNHFSRQ